MNSEATLRPTVEIDPQGAARRVSERALRGGIALGLRQVLVQAMNLAGMVALARTLAPADFGWYAVGAFALSVLASFGDVGLGASLVRKQSEPTVLEWRSVFTVQLLLALAAAGVLFAAAPGIAAAYGNPDMAGFLRLLPISLPFVAVQAVPTLRMERALDFRGVAAVEVAQAFAFNATAVSLAMAGFGVTSIAVALAVRSAVGAALASRMSHWSWGFALDVGQLRSHLGFGIPYQAASLASLLKWSITPVFVGLLLGPTDVGYIYWAQTVATYAVAALMILQRLYLPVFARLQAHPDDLARLVARVIFATNSIVAPAAVLLLVLITPITLLVYGEKWLPAVPLFYGLWLANLLSATSTPLLGVLNALGQSRLTLAFTLLWMAATWVLGAPMILAFGAIGYVLASAVIQLTTFLLFATAGRYVSLHLWRSAAPPWLLAGVMGLGVMFLAKLAPPNNLLLLLFDAVVGLAVFALLLVHRYRIDLVEAVTYLKTARTD